MSIDNTEIENYAAAVRTALADLPEATRNELLEDLTDHLTEVAAEQDGGTLLERLGAPEQYAAELRATLPGGGVTATQRRWSATFGKLRTRLTRVDARLGRIVGFGQFSEYAKLLRPAWWIVRGYVAAQIFVHLVGRETSRELMPSLDGNGFVGFLLMVGAIIGSIWLGRRSTGFRIWPRRFVAASSIVIAFVGLVSFFEVNDSLQNGPMVVYQTSGSPLENVEDIYAYDEQGNLLTGVRLFDQFGNPIMVGYSRCADGRLGQVVKSDGTVTVYKLGVPEGYPFCPEFAPTVLPLPSKPRQVDPTVEPSPTGSANPSAAPSPSALATAKPTPSAG